MSFRCEECNDPQESGVPPRKVVTKIRYRHYDDGVPSQGWEIAEEKRVCEPCETKLGIVDILEDAEVVPPDPGAGLRYAVYAA